MKVVPGEKVMYSDAKAAAKGYTEAKLLMVAAFVGAGLGRWVGKPMEQDQFELTVVAPKVKTSTPPENVSPMIIAVDNGKVPDAETTAV